MGPCPVAVSAAMRNAGATGPCQIPDTPSVPERRAESKKIVRLAFLFSRQRMGVSGIWHTCMPERALAYSQPRDNAHITPNPQAASAGLAVGRLATAVAARRPTGTAAAPKEAKAGFRPSSSGLLSPWLGGHHSHHSTPGPLPMTTNHPRALAHHPRCLWGPGAASGGAKRAKTGPCEFRLPAGHGPDLKTSV